MEASFKKKVLIYIPENRLQPTGGMAGYNYNLKLGLEEIGASNYYYLPPSETLKAKIDKAQNSWLKKAVSLWLRVFYYLKLLFIGGGYSSVDFNDFDVVHFHNAKDLYCASETLKNYKGIVVLTNHSPKPWSSELYDAVTDFERKWLGWLYKRMTVVDRIAFDRANYIIFPCEDAEEPYYNNWKEYRNVHNRNAEKYRYLLTGTKPCEAKVDREIYRAQHGISTDTFVISYAGRHNKVKGYDLLCELGHRLKNDDDISFLVAGKYNSESIPKLERWKEIGWTDDPHSLISASDIFVLPNRETYFDLIMLEVLSLGVIVVASRTGGNKYFEKCQENGIFLYSNLDEAEKIIRTIKDMTPERRKELGLKNKMLYKSLFTLDKFATHYVDIINELPDIRG